ncbi:uncharacterized protein M6B38_105575 [Iris pallida]|uniref:Uncharacterized protein n=1 Tax=Iris pallida TaxID=29817 RepID=A0AAX6ERU0_IRIPA|nr:uncharacterized protein M6B38_105575 [Iris pallida]
MGSQKRGSISFFSTYRPPVPLDLFSCAAQPTSKQDESPLTDGVSYNYNGQVLPPAALKNILKRPKLAAYEGKAADVDSGRLSGMLFVSERGSLETLHIALRLDDKVTVFGFADVFGTFSGVRMEDSGYISGGDYLVYVTTKDPAADRRQPWTAVYSTNLKTATSERLTPTSTADLSPAMSPSGKLVAVASFQRKDGGWDGEIEDLQTNIFVMNVKRPPGRKLVVRNGGWPTWGSESVLFFHRKVGDFWGVFRVDIGGGTATETRVTPDGITAITPAAINETTVAVATIRQKSGFSDVRVEAQYRHIEIFDTTGANTKITQKIRPKADHFNPFVINGGKRIGYHRAKSEMLKSGDDIPRQFYKLDSPHPDVGLFRVAGVFPTFNRDGSMVSFVDNEFKSVWVADSKGSRIVYGRGADNVFSPVWSQNPDIDTLYVCMGPSFQSKERLDICAIVNVKTSKRPLVQRLTNGFNNAFPSTNPEGTKLVFRSTKDGGEKKHKNLYIMQDAQSPGGEITRLTTGEWTDTHCQWSPSGNWIVFSSTRDKPVGAPETDNGLDPGYFAVFIVKWNDPSVVVRVVTSASNVPGSVSSIAGHVNHPFFSPDGRSLVVTADLAAVTADPISLPLFVHSVRPYGDIFTVDIDPDDISKNKDVKDFKRVTHSRYENSTATWSTMLPTDPNAAWAMKLSDKSSFSPACPYVYPDGGESSHMTGHLFLPKRCC